MISWFPVRTRRSSCARRRAFHSARRDYAGAVIRWVLRANYKKAAEDPLLRMNLPRMRTKQRSNVGYTIISDGGNLLQVSTGRKNHIHTGKDGAALELSRPRLAAVIRAHAVV